MHSACNESIATWLLVLGFTGQAIFGSRFLVQWIFSEMKGESHIPIAFWFISIAGGFLLLTYAILRREPVFIFGQSMGVLVYSRNLMLIYRKRKTAPQAVSGLESKGAST